MFTRKLLRHFFTFSIFALMLLPQSSAFAAGISAVPSPPGIPNTNCLNVSGSTVSSGSIAPTPPPGTPGQSVKYIVSYYVENNCPDTVGSIIIGGPISVTCPGNSVNVPQNAAFIVSGNLANGQHVDAAKNTWSYCVVYTNNVPTLSVLPTSIGMTIEAKGTDVNGISVSSPKIPMVIKW